MGDAAQNPLRCASVKTRFAMVATALFGTMYWKRGPCVSHEFFTYYFTLTGVMPGESQ